MGSHSFILSSSPCLAFAYFYILLGSRDCSLLFLKKTIVITKMQFAFCLLFFAFFLFLVFDKSTTQQFRKISLPLSRLDSVKDEIVADHNQKRSQVSPPATNMKNMQWNDGLANLAQKWSEGCVYNHGFPPESVHMMAPDGNTFRNLGQNLALGDNSWREFMDDWYNEYEYFDYCKNEKTTESPTIMIGHYTQLVWENSTHVGCGKTNCPKPKLPGGLSGYDYRNVDYIVCNYWPPGNMKINNVKLKPYRSKPGVCATKNGNGEGPNFAAAYAAPVADADAAPIAAGAAAGAGTVILIIVTAIFINLHHFKH